MAKERSSTSRYPSNYDGGWVSASQYITECLCVLIAKRERKNLDDQFWNKEPWTAIFRRQVPLAVKMLTQHPPEVILSVLRDRRSWKVNSFGANWLLKPLLTQKQREYDAQIAQQTNKTTIKVSTIQKPRRTTPKGNKSLFSQLKEAE